MKAQGPWLVAKCDFGTSKVTGSDMTTITMINQKEEIVHSYIEHTYRNYKNWTAVIRGFDNGWGITIDDLRYNVKDSEIQQRHIRVYNIKENLIDADSRPVSVEVEDTLQQAVDKFFEDKTK
jgi:hypothetical protein